MTQAATTKPARRGQGMPINTSENTASEAALRRDMRHFDRQIAAAQRRADKELLALKNLSARMS